MRLGGIDVHVGELSDQLRVVAAEVNNAVVFGAPLQFARVFFRVIGHQNPLSGADHLPADLKTLLVQAVLQRIEALFFALFWRVVNQVGRRRARALAVHKGVREVETDVLDQLHGLLEVLLGFTGEADDKVRADANARHRRTQFAQLGFVLQRRVVALHGRQNAVRARLHRQVQVFYQLRHVGMRLDQAIRELQRVRGGVANALDPVDGCHHANQFSEVRQATVLGQAAIAVDVLAQQGHFTHAVFGQVKHFAEHVVERAADFFATGVRHHAERAVLAATFHDRHIGTWAVDAGFWQVVEFLDFGERHVNLRQLGDARSVDHLGQAVKGLRAEDYVHVRSAVADGGAFLTGNAAADGNDHLGVGQFQLAPAAQLRVHAVLGAFTDRTGIQQDDISVFGARCDFQGLMFTQQINHA